MHAGKVLCKVNSVIRESQMGGWAGHGGGGHTRQIDLDVVQTLLVTKCKLLPSS